MEKNAYSHSGNKPNDWLRSLAFYAEELDHDKGRLAGILTKTNDPEVAEIVRYYENQFSIRQEHMDSLRCQIRDSMTSLSKQAELSEEHAMDSALADQFNRLSEMFETQEKTLTGLRRAFIRFSAPWEFYLAD